MCDPHHTKAKHTTNLSHSPQAVHLSDANPTMTHLTIGYSDSEDRLWLVFTDDTKQLWLTRRMTGIFLSRMAHQMTLSCPGATMDSSLKAEVRVALEFQTAHEAEHDPILHPPPPRDSSNSPASSHLISAITLKVSSNTIHFEPIAPGFRRTIILNRIEAHRLMGAFARRVAIVDWQIPELPAWLIAATKPQMRD
jgi:hypothetical protein